MDEDHGTTAWVTENAIIAALHLYVTNFESTLQGKREVRTHAYEMDECDKSRVVVHEQGPCAAVSSETTHGNCKSNVKQLWDPLATSVDLHPVHMVTVQNPLLHMHHKVTNRTDKDKTCWKRWTHYDHSTPYI